MRRVLALWLAAVWLAGCPGGSDPRERVRDRIDEAVGLAEARAIGRLVELVSDRYRDGRGRDADAVRGMARLYLAQNRSIHLLHRIPSIELPEPGEAEVVVLVAAAGRPIEGVGQLGEIRADLLRFDLHLIEERGAWRLVGMSWEPAAATDFF